jgi:hypothetical protein
MDNNMRTVFAGSSRRSFFFAPLHIKKEQQGETQKEY